MNSKMLSRFRTNVVLPVSEPPPKRLEGVVVFDAFLQ